MFERFTERARQVLVLAQDEARKRANSHVEVPHLLLGLIREEAGLASKVLQYVNITADDASRFIIEGSDESNNSLIPFSEDAKKVCELALREALSLGYNYIGTEHLLLGLDRWDEDSYSGFLPSGVRDETLRMLQGSSQPQSTDKLTVSFDIEVGQVWVGPNGTEWTIEKVSDSNVTMSRTTMNNEFPTDLVRLYRKVAKS